MRTAPTFPLTPLFLLNFGFVCLLAGIGACVGDDAEVEGSSGVGSQCAASAECASGLACVAMVCQDPNQTPQPDAQPDAQPEAQPDVQPDAQPGAQPDPSPEVEPDAQPDAQPGMTPDPQPEPDPEGWPPSLDEVYDANATGDRCIIADCDEGGDSGYDNSGTWVRTLTTTATDCSDIIAGADPRANVGEVTVEEPGPLSIFRGSCVFNSSDTRIGAVFSGVQATCSSSEEMLGVTAYETAVLTFSGDSGSGVARVYLTNVPDIAGGDCSLTFDMSLQRQ